ncbi:MAG: hypothetical protein ACE5K1_11045 [Acidiferrobacterales bacterium]
MIIGAGALPWQRQVQADDESVAGNDGTGVPVLLQGHALFLYDARG